MLISKLKKKSSLYSILLIFLLDNFGLGVVYPIFTPLLLRSQFHFFPEDYPLFNRTLLLGILVASFPLAQFFGAPFLGELSDRIGRKKIFFLTISGSFICYTLLGVSVHIHSYLLLIVSRLFSGFFAGNQTLCLASIADLSQDDKERTDNFSIIASIGGLSFILAITLGGFFSNSHINASFGPGLPFWITAALFLFNLLFMQKFFQETHQTFSHKSYQIFQGFHNVLISLKITPLRYAYFVYFFYVVSWVTAMQFLPALLIDRFQVTTAGLSIVLMSIGLIWFTTNLSLNRLLSKYFPPRNTLLFSLPLLGFFLFLSMISSTLPLFLLHFFLAVVFGAATWTNALANVSLCAPLEIQGRVLGINQSFGALASFFGPAFGGFLFALNAHLSLFMASFASLTALGLLIKFFYAEKKKRK